MIKPTAIIYTQWDKKQRREVPMMVTVVTGESTNSTGRAGTIYSDVASGITSDMANMKGDSYTEMATELVNTDSVSSGGYGKGIEVLPYSGENIKMIQKMIEEIKKALPVEEATETPEPKEKPKK